MEEFQEGFILNQNHPLCNHRMRTNHLIRDLHLYLGLFISPFVLVFSISVFYLVHAWLPPTLSDAAVRRTVSDLPLPQDLGALSGRMLIDSLQPALAKANVQGEVGFIRHLRKENRLVIPVIVPGRETIVSIEVASRQASIEQRHSGLADTLVMLHKSPGPHLAAIRMNWIYMRFWRWLADATVYLILFLSVSGVYLWSILRSERTPGLCLLILGALSFFGIVYALVP